MNQENTNPFLGELKPSQIIYNFGVGSIIDFPNISAMVKGLNFWDVKSQYTKYFNEPRLKFAIERFLGKKISFLSAPPSDAAKGIPVLTFPKWMRCPLCGRITTVDNKEIFQLKVDNYRSDRNQYVHANCSKSNGKVLPTVFPVRRLMACSKGHIDDFPWMYFVHRGNTECQGPLYWKEKNATGEPEDISIECKGCDTTRSLVEALGDAGKKNLPPKCSGYHPHLDTSEDCDEEPRVIVLGASNIWFPMALSIISLPRLDDSLSKVDEAILKEIQLIGGITTKEVIPSFRSAGVLRSLHSFSDEEIWSAINRYKNKNQDSASSETQKTDLKAPEWTLFTMQEEIFKPEFVMKNTELSVEFQAKFTAIKKIERLKEVVSLVGFSRLISPGEFGDQEDTPQELRAPLFTDSTVDWVPTIEVKGEGIFIQFNETVIQEWLRRNSVKELESKFLESYKRSRRNFGLDENIGFPGMRYILIHSFSHAFMRQLSLECGYSLASLKERIYCKEAPEPRAGVLIYTAAADSEGTLGGLVNLASKEYIQKLLLDLQSDMKLCSSDPHCAEHEPDLSGTRLHGASCHSCLFIPETSCEKGNKFLDRKILVETVSKFSEYFF